MQGNRFKALDSLIVFFSFFALATLPFDSFPNLFPSVYRPLSVVFIIICSPLVALRYLTHFRWRFFIVFLEKYIFIILFCLFAIPMSYFFTSKFYLPYSGSQDFVVTLVLGVATLFVLSESNTILIERLKSNRRFIKLIFTLIALIYIPVLIFGVVETLVVIGVIPVDVKRFLVSWAVPFIHDRIQLFSGEASWASMHLIFIIPIYLYLLKVSWLYMIALILSVGLLLFSFSMQGLLTLGIAVFVIFIIYFRRIKPIYFVIAFGFVASLALIWIFVQNKYSDIYFVTRIYKMFEIEKVSDLLYLDGSVFVRFVYPSLAIFMGINYPLLGVGGGNYRYFFGQYLFKYFDKGIQYEEVYMNYISDSSNPKNLIARLFGETGIVGTILFIAFIFSVMTKINYVKSDVRPYLVIWSVFIFANMMQFDSFAYMHLWVMLSVIISLRLEYEDEKYIY